MKNRANLFTLALLASVSSSCGRTFLQGGPAQVQCTSGCTPTFPVTSILNVGVKALTLSNSGGSDASSLVLSGLAAPFSILGGSWPGTGGTCGNTLAVGGSCTVTLGFNPQTGGTYTGASSISYASGTGTGLLSMPIQGSAVSQGTLDPAFNLIGYDLIDYGDYFQEINDLVVQADATIMLVGTTQSTSSSNSAYSVIRMLPNGTVDTSYGTHGRVTTMIAGTAQDIASAGIMQSDDEVVVVGNAGTHISLSKYIDDGTLDPLFGLLSSGIDMLIPLVSGDTETVSKVAQLSDGTMLAVGKATPLVGTPTFFVLHLNALGLVDVTLPIYGAPNGEAFVSFGAGNTDTGQAIAIQADGKAVIAGSSIASGVKKSAVARLTSAGVLDTTFGGGTGKALFDICGSGGDNEIEDVAVQSDQKIVSAGYCLNGSQKDMVVARFTSTGAPDASFGTNGVTVVDFGGHDDQGNRVRIQNDGKIVVAGYSNNGSVDSAAMIRLTPSGALDALFGVGGKIVTPLAPGNGRSLAMALQSDGKILLGGYANTGSGTVYAILRYLP